MKKILVILGLCFFTGFAGFGQEDDDNAGPRGKLQERMNDYIQKKLGLSKSEAEKFKPVFFRYLAELRQTHRDNKGDRPVLQLRVAELRVRFRDQFREILDEKRANRVFVHQREFEKIVTDEIKLRRSQNRHIRRNKTVIDN